MGIGGHARHDRDRLRSTLRSRTKTEGNKLLARRYQGGFRNHLGPHESREAFLFLTQITRKGACYSQSSISTRFKNRKGETSRASIWILTCRTTFCRSSRHPFISRRGPISVTCPKVNW